MIVTKRESMASLILGSLVPRPSASSALLTFELAPNQKSVQNFWLHASSKVKRALEAEGLGTRLDPWYIQALYYDIVCNEVIIRACIRIQRCHTFSFGHYHQVPGASCGILYILVLSLVLFMQSLYPLSMTFFSYSFHFLYCF